MADPVQLRVVGVLKAWMDNYFLDFVGNQELGANLIAFLEGNSDKLKYGEYSVCGGNHVGHNSPL